MKELNNQEDIQKRIAVINKRQEQIKEEKQDITKSLDKRYNKNIDEISSLRQRLAEVCTHSDTITKETFVEGSYLNQSYIRYKKTCNICNTIIKEWESDGLGYG